jgi:hypothetical protein
MAALGSPTLALANPGTHLPGYARENVTVGMIHIGGSADSTGHTKPSTSTPSSPKTNRPGPSESAG